MARQAAILPQICPKCSLFEGSLALRYYPARQYFAFVIYHTIPKHFRRNITRRACIFRVKKQKIAKFFKNIDTTIQRMENEKTIPGKQLAPFNIKIPAKLLEDIQKKGWSAIPPMSSRYKSQHFLLRREKLLKIFDEMKMHVSLKEFYLSFEEGKKF